MATKVHMEALSPTMEEGQVVRWLKQEGDEVAEGDILAEIETDKATMELVARGSGVLRKQLLGEGATAPVGAVIGVVAAPDEDISDLLAAAAAAEEPAPAAEAKPAEAAAAAETAAPSPAVRAEPAVAVEAGPAATDGRTKASPLARRLARDAGLEIERVRGTGPGGRITKRDIEAALESQAAFAAAPAPVFGEARPDVEEVPLSQMRKTIAKRLVTSIGPIPTFYLTIDFNAGRLNETRRQLNARLEASGEKVSLNDLILKATAAALARHPEVNASWGDSVINRYGRVHLGVAVAIDDGLITPVIRDADRKGVAQIGREVRELAKRAREKKLKPEEYSGATFSVSNLGMFGIEEFTAIINPPESGILAVGAVEDRAAVVDGQIVVQSRCRITMSCDHRVIDGATGAVFLQTLKGFLEEPATMLL